MPPRPCVAPHDGYPFCNTSLPLAARVDDLISRLTLDEKPYLLVAREADLRAAHRRRAEPRGELHRGRIIKLL